MTFKHEILTDLGPATFVCDDEPFIATDRGMAGIFKCERDPDRPPLWGVCILRYLDGIAGDRDELVAKAFAESEADARLIASALAHHYICPDCERGN